MKSIFLSSTVDLTNPAVYGSPRVVMIPRVSLPASSDSPDVVQFEIPATAAEGFEARGNITWASASITHYTNLVSLAPNASHYLGVNQTTGLVSVNVRCWKDGMCASDLQIAVVVKRFGTSGMVDFIVRIQRNVLPDVHPTITLKAPENNPVLQGMESALLRGIPTVNAFSEFPVVLTFKGTDQQKLATFFEYSVLPMGAIVSARRVVDPITLTYAQEILWTPAEEQVKPTTTSVE